MSSVDITIDKTRWEQPIGLVLYLDRDSHGSQTPGKSCAEASAAREPAELGAAGRIY